jgi:hypothetical protein
VQQFGQIRRGKDYGRNFEQLKVKSIPLDFSCLNRIVIQVPAESTAFGRKYSGKRSVRPVSAMPYSQNYKILKIRSSQESGGQT